MKKTGFIHLTDEYEDFLFEEIYHQYESFGIKMAPSLVQKKLTEWLQKHEDVLLDTLATQVIQEAFCDASALHGKGVAYLHEMQRRDSQQM